MDAVVAAPGNPGIDTIARCEPLADVTDADAVLELATRLARRPRRHRPRGAAGRRRRPTSLRARGFRVLRAVRRGGAARGQQGLRQGGHGRRRRPDRAAPTSARPPEEVEDALDALGAPHVVKDDGLAAGKGVVVTDDRDEALDARPRLPGEAGRPGRRRGVPRRPRGVAVLRHRRHDGRRPAAGPGLQAGRRRRRRAQHRRHGRVLAARLGAGRSPTHVVERVAQPTVDEMRRRGTPFVGVLYVGLALTSTRAAGDRVQRPLRRPRTPGRRWPGCARRSAACCTPPPTVASTSSEPLRDRPRHAVTVVVAARRLPGRPATGDPITGVDDRRGPRRRLGPARRHRPGRRRRSSSPPAAGSSTSSPPARPCGGARRAHTGPSRRSQLEGGHHRTDIALAAQRGEVTVG